MQGALVMLDIIGGAILIKLMVEITNGWGLRDAQARWALFRRFVLLVMGLSLFVRGVYRIDAPPLDWVDGSSQIVILIGILIFPILRGFNVISQDRWGPTNGAREDRPQERTRRDQREQRNFQ